MPVMPRLTDKDVERLEKALKDGERLEVERAQENGYGGGYSCVAGSTILFSCGDSAAFDALMEQARIVEDKMKVLTPKEVAIKLLTAMSDKPHGALYLLRKAQVGDSYLETAEVILPKLASAQKIKKVIVEGKTRWRLP